MTIQAEPSNDNHAINKLYFDNSLNLKQNIINEKNLKNIIIIDENRTSYTSKGIHYEQSLSTNYYDMLNFLSTIIILSKCKYIICSSGNCSIWIMLYRGHNKNVIQYLNGNWYNSVINE